MLRQFKLNDIEDIFVTDYVANGSFQSLKENVKEVESGPVIMIRLVDFNNSWQGPFKYLDLESFKFLSKSSLEKGDIIISNVGANIGTVFRAPDLDKKMTLGPNSVVLKVSMDPEIIDKDFLYYFFSSPKGQHLLQSISGGSAQPKFNKTDLRNLIIEIPDLKIQKRFSKILLSIDKKIELNQQMNKTLEDIAKKLFKSWFIDFDPVRAKAEGRPTGLSKEISDLFPDSFEDSELGEIPSGWQIKEIQELCESISSGGTPKRKQKDYWENGTIDWFKTGELRDTYLLESEEKITDSAVKESSCKLWNKGTILFAIYASPTVGRLGILTKPSTSNQAAAGLMPKESVGMPFLKNLLLFSRKEMQHIASGAAQQNINVGILKEFKVISPNHEIAGHFSKINEPIEKKIFSNLREISYLSQIRDLLLPKLISGELKISDAENMVEGADI